MRLCLSPLQEIRGISLVVREMWDTTALNPRPKPHEEVGILRQRDVSYTSGLEFSRAPSTAARRLDTNPVTLAHLNTALRGKNLCRLLCRQSKMHFR